MKIVHHFGIIHNNSSYKLIRSNTDITRWAKGYLRTKKLARDFSKADDILIRCHKLGKLIFSYYYVSPFIFGSTELGIHLPYSISLLRFKILFKHLFGFNLRDYLRERYFQFIESNNFQKLYWKIRIKAIKLKLLKGRGG